MNLPDPVFFDTDENTIINEIIADYESAVGKKLAPAQAERLLINAFGLREKMIRIAGNEAAKQCFLEFATYPMLDYLGDLLNVERLPASKAECTLVFSLTQGHGSFLIPDSIRVQSTDGRVVFVTLESKNVLSTDNSISIAAECTTDGLAGNDYKVGDISIVLDPQAFIDSISNSDITAGGADQESDDALRERIRLAPNSFSTAGPEGAYEYFAKSAHPAIIDIAITSPIPGHINIYPLLAGGVQPSQEIIDAVMAKCNPDDMRPMNDIVSVNVPVKVDYSIVVNVTLLDNAIQDTTVELINTNLTDYANVRKTSMGVNVVRGQIVSLSVIKDQVYDVVVIAPATDLVIDENQFANCTGIQINIVGNTAG